MAGGTVAATVPQYDAPPDITPIEEVAATGWGDEFSDDPGKVTILEERNDWDDDERSGGKVLVIQERLAQNQQEFLDEYLPQWDENLAIQKQELESEWENPFTAKRGSSASSGITLLFMQHADAPVSIIAVVPKAAQLGISNSTLTL
ncbi:hypothetical protein Tco_1558221 [Tanacetum coccineum]